MKTLLIIAIVFICGSLKPTIKPCSKQMVQKFYLDKTLVHLQTYDSFITEVGCVSIYMVKGKRVVADSVVTTLK